MTNLFSLIALSAILLGVLLACIAPALRFVRRGFKPLWGALSVLLLLLCFLASAPKAHAQKSGVYPLLTGNTEVLPAASTNLVYTTTSTNQWGAPGTATNLVLQVAEYDYAGLTFSFLGVAATTNVSLLIYKSFDNGVTYETTATFQYNNINAGAATYVTNAALDIHGVTHLAFVTRVIGTGQTTNTALKINLKAPKVGAKTATQ